jgi:DNA-binding beta-propeller fold protein YncE
VTWVSVSAVADPVAPAGPLRHAVAGATPFNGGEGVLFDDGFVYLTTKGDDRVWVHDIAARTMTVLYDSSEHISPVLNGVDNVAVSAAHDLYVAEDGGNLEVCVITPERAVFSIVRMTGGQHGIENPTPIPLVSEVTGLALSPDGNRLYFNSERGMGLGGLPVGPGPGILYEVTGPFRGGTLARARTRALLRQRRRDAARR